MANASHLDILMRGVKEWNVWHAEMVGSKSAQRRNEIEWQKTGDQFALFDLSEADLADRNLNGIDFSHTNLSNGNLRRAHLYGAKLVNATLDGANLQHASLIEAKLNKASLRHARLSYADLLEADLRGAQLEGAFLIETRLAWTQFNEGASLRGAHLQDSNLHKADLSSADLTGADLRGTRLTGAVLIDSCLCNARLDGASVYGASAWNLNLHDSSQNDLVITDPENANEPRITVDNIEVAQFIHLLINHKKIRDIIGTIGEKGVLILGRFTPERKEVLHAIRDELRRNNFLPMLFDFDRPPCRDFTETIVTIAGLSRFVIADITNPRCSPLELEATVPTFEIPFVPIIDSGECPFAMFEDIQKFDWVLPLLKYDSKEQLIQVFSDAVLAPAVAMSERLLKRKMNGVYTRHAQDYIRCE